LTAAPAKVPMGVKRAQGGRTAYRFYILQRVTALVMAPMVLIHLATILYATSKGLSAEAILGRTQGSVLWASFYSVFVVAAAIHGTIGLRTVLAETLGWRLAGLDVLMLCFFIFILGTGLRAVVILT
jgi:fumarate reductase subunit C